MSKPVFPNTFIIGIQKAGTTTLDAWLSEHPEIYCYDSLKDVHLFARFKTREEMEQRMAKETPAYNQEPIVLQSAVNYIFYPSLLESISKYSPDAKLIVILRNPIDRAISSYHYFTKMLREKRSMENALLYTPKDDLPFSADNNDFTYLEHGFYFRQIINCYHFFKKDQLLILDYDDLAANPDELVHKIFSFLNIDNTFKPNFNAKNITGTVKSDFVQSKILGTNKYRKWVVDHLIDSWFPVNKRKMLKKKIFEFNTAKSNAPKLNQQKEISEEGKLNLKKQLKNYFSDDVKNLDKLLGTQYAQKWLGEINSL